MCLALACVVSAPAGSERQKPGHCDVLHVSVYELGFRQSCWVAQASLKSPTNPVHSLPQTAFTD